jgi:hypothetical protein
VILACIFCGSEKEYPDKFLEDYGPVTAVVCRDCVQNAPEYELNERIIAAGED